MPSNPHTAATVVALLMTYLLHSTLLLGAVWIGLSLIRTRSAALQDRLWKLAALAPLLTAPLQLAAADRLADWSVWTLPALELAGSSPSVAPTAPDERAEAWDVPTTTWEGEAPAEPVVQNLPPDARSIPLEGPLAETGFAESADVEIVPGPDLTDKHFEQSLPTIEPAVLPDDDLAQFPVIIAELESPSAMRDVPEQIAVSTTIAPERGPSFVEPRHDWRQPLALVVSVIVAVGLLRIACRSLIAQGRLLRSRTVSDGPLRNILDRLRTERGVHSRVRLATSIAASEPAAGGIFRWTILVPDGIEDRLSPAEQHALLAHELAHLVRRDPLWLWIGTALCTCLPFQVLNFLAARRWRQAAEELCDDWAIAGGVRPLTLANCLTRVAEWRLAPMPLGLTSDVGQSRFARRIGRLVSGEFQPDRWSRPTRRRLLLAGALACAALLTCCGPRMQAGATRDDAQPEAGPVVEIEPADEPEPATTDDGAVSTGESVVADSPDLAAVPTLDDIRAEIASLLTDLERVDLLLSGASGGNDDPEINDARARLREQLQALRERLAGLELAHDITEQSDRVNTDD